MQSILNFFITFIYLNVRYIIKNTDSYKDAYKFVRCGERLNYDAAKFLACAVRAKNTPHLII